MKRLMILMVVVLSLLVGCSKAPVSRPLEAVEAPSVSEEKVIVEEEHMEDVSEELVDTSNKENDLYEPLYFYDSDDESASHIRHNFEMFEDEVILRDINAFFEAAKVKDWDEVRARVYIPEGVRESEVIPTKWLDHNILGMPDSLQIGSTGMGFMILSGKDTFWTGDHYGFMPEGKYKKELVLMYFKTSVLNFLDENGDVDLTKGVRGAYSVNGMVLVYDGDRWKVELDIPLQNINEEILRDPSIIDQPGAYDKYLIDYLNWFAKNANNKELKERVHDDMMEWKVPRFFLEYYTIGQVKVGIPLEEVGN